MTEVKKRPFVTRPYGRGRLLYEGRPRPYGRATTVSLSSSFGNIESVGALAMTGSIGGSATINQSKVAFLLRIECFRIFRRSNIQ